MNKKNSKAKYSKENDNYFSDFRSSSMMSDSPWEEIDEANEFAHLGGDFDMELGEDMYFDDIMDYGDVDMDDLNRDNHIDDYIEDANFSHFGYLSEDYKKD